MSPRKDKNEKPVLDERMRWDDEGYVLMRGAMARNNFSRP